jgi:hypothetical protein
MPACLRRDRGGQGGHDSRRGRFGVQRCDVGSECPSAALRPGLEEELPPGCDEVRRIAPRIERSGAVAPGERLGDVILRKQLTAFGRWERGQDATSTWHRSHRFYLTVIAAI